MPETTQPDIGLGAMILRRCALTPALPALSFEGATLDYKDGLNAAGFAITNPNATRTCGCGSSFS